MNAPGRITTIDLIAHELIRHAVPFDLFLREALASGQKTFATRNQYPQWVARLLRSEIRADLPPMTCTMSIVDADGPLPAGTLMGVRYLALSEGITYHSAHILRTGNERVSVPAHILVDETTLPDTMMTGYVGQHVTALVDHPALRHPDLMIAGLSDDEGSLVIQLPEILVDAGPEGLDAIPYSRPARSDE